MERDGCGSIFLSSQQVGDRGRLIHELSPINRRDSGPTTPSRTYYQPPEELTVRLPSWYSVKSSQQVYLLGILWKAHSRPTFLEFCEEPTVGLPSRDSMIFLHHLAGNQTFHPWPLETFLMQIFICPLPFLSSLKSLKWLPQFSPLHCEGHHKPHLATEDSRVFLARVRLIL